MLGYEAIYVGDAEIKEFGDPSTAIVTSAVKEIFNGDRLVPQRDDELYSNFIPSAPDKSVAGNIISALDVLSEIGQYQVVVLDKGIADGVKIGNVFGIYQSGRTVTDKVKNSAEKNSELKSKDEQVTLPEVRSGVMMVFRAFDQVSYALVMEALRPMHLYDNELLSEFCSPSNITNAETTEMKRLGLNQDTIDSIVTPDWKLIEADLDWLTRPGNHFISMHY